MTKPTPPMKAPDPQPDDVCKAIANRSFCTLATASAANRPHVAAVLYRAIDNTLYVHMLRNSKKARNIAANPRVTICIPIRRLPVGPPSSVQFEAAAEILAMDDPDITTLLPAGCLDAIAGHGALDEANGCFLRIIPAGRINTYGLGLPLRRLIRDPLHAGGTVVLAGSQPETSR